LPRDRAVFW